MLMAPGAEIPMLSQKSPQAPVSKVKSLCTCEFAGKGGTSTFAAADAQLRDTEIYNTQLEYDTKTCTRSAAPYDGTGLTLWVAPS